MYQEGIVPSSDNKKKMHNKEEDEEKSQVYTKEGEEEKSRIKGKKDHANLNWLDSIGNMLSDEEKALVEKTDDWVYIDRLVSNKDKARIETLMKDEEFLISMEAEHGASNRLNNTGSPRTGIEIQQEVTESCYYGSRRKKTGKQELQRNHATRRAWIRKNNPGR